ncbi:MAG: flagellin [Pontibacterium sp.]
MAMVINSNIMSLSAQRNLTTAQADQNQAMERLTSGKRINSAADDAAGLAISTRMTSQVQGLDQAVRNANDGVSMIQTAEGALEESTNILQRMRELSVQSANGTYQEGNRSTLDAEVQQLKAELDRISEDTTFNGLTLLDGSQSNISLQVGADAGQSIDLTIGKVTSDSLGVADAGGVSAQGTDNALASGDLTINGVTVGTSKAADDTASTNNAAASSIAKAAAINAVSGETNVKAVVNENTVAGSAMTAPGAAVDGTVTINDVAISVTATTDAAATRAALVEAINGVSEQTGVTAIDQGEDSQGVALVAADGRNIELALTTVTAAQTGLSADGTYEGSYTLVANAGVSEITVAGGEGTGNGDITNSGLIAGTYSAGIAGVSSTEQTGVALSAATLNIDLSSLVNTGGAVASSSFGLAVDGAAAADVAVAANVGEYADNTALLAGMTAPSGYTITAINGGAATDGLFSLTSSTTGSDSELTLSAGGTGADLGLSGTDTGSDGPDALDTGDLVINNVAINAAKTSDDTASYAAPASSSKTASGISIAAAINASTSDTGVTATVNTTEVTGGTSTTAVAAATNPGAEGNAGAVWVNGVEVGLTVQDSAENNRTHAVDQINAVSDQTGVMATDNGSSLTLTAADGRNISLAIDTNAANASGGITGAHFGLAATVSGISESDITAAGGAQSDADAVAETTYSTVTLSSASDIEIKGGTNGNSALEDLGFKAGTYGGGADGQYIKDVDISTSEGAQKAITAIDNALDQVSDVRSELGAVNNRLDFTISNLSSVSENAAAAKSRIEDADFAQESANLSRAQVLQQAGTAMLAQANAAPQQVLSLLQ